jgi:regulator of sigma E protease
VYIVISILAFSVLIIGHEFGHFIMAKINNVKVEEFSIGMGPKLFSFKGKETEYLIKALPIGGYVRMLGEEEKSNDKRSFSSKSPERRLSIIVAGPFMNVLLAVLFFMITAFSDGFLVPTISGFTDISPAQEVGLQVGDRVTRVNGKKVRTWNDFSSQIYAAQNNEISLTIIRDKEEKGFVVTPVLDETGQRFIIGVLPTEISNPSIAQASSYGIVQTRSLVSHTFTAFRDLFRNLIRGNVSGNEVGGPVTILKISGEAARAGIGPLLWFCALISIQLAIFNVIPFPALDGGWIMLLLFEIVTRKKVDDKKVAVVNYIGFTILMILMVLVTIKDIFFPINF